MRLLSILFFCSLLCCLACSLGELEVNEELTEDKMEVEEEALVLDCPIIEGAKMISEDSLPCDYNEVYRFKEKIYTYCVCCLCRKWAPPINCDGEVLCSEPDSCWQEFKEEAEYLFAIEEL